MILYIYVPQFAYRKLLNINYFITTVLLLIYCKNFYNI